MNRRSFLKILGLGGAGIGLASSATAANLLQGTKINGNTVFHQGNDYSGTGSSNSALDADQVDGFDIQKNGNDTTGVINFNTNNNQITVDGQIVFSSVPDDIIFDFSTNPLSQFLEIETDGGSSNWSYNNNRVRADSDNDNHIAVVDIRDEMSSSPTVSVSSTMDDNDNDGMGVVLVDDDLDQVYTLFATDDWGGPGQPAGNIDSPGISIITNGIDPKSGGSTFLAGWNKGLSGTNNLKLTYDGTTLTGEHNDGTTISVVDDFSVGYAGLGSWNHSPPPEFFDLEIKFS